MEAIQVLKFALKQSRLNFTAHLQLPEHSMTRDGPDRTDILTDMLKMNPNALHTFLQTLNFCD
jgi:trehalose-6-phosphate synthase